MGFLPVLAAALLFVGAIIFGIPLLRRLLRYDAARYDAHPRAFPPEWREIAGRRVPLTALLTDDEWGRLERRALEFLDQVRFEPVGGVAITDELRIVVATQAGLLALGLEAGCYDEVRTILIYPSSFVPRRASLIRDLESVSPPAIGESVGTGTLDHGTVVLAHDSIFAGAADPTDGHNVVFHELAHQLDRILPSVGSDPAPVSRARDDPEFQRSLERLTADLEAGREAPLDPYGTTNLNEFFAVATESFFERADEVRAYDPELYQALLRFYRQDPARLRRPPPWRSEHPAS
jgi:Mlc titration factor MtfA (ptsG expression regulator)